MRPFIEFTLTLLDEGTETFELTILRQASRSNINFFDQETKLHVRTSAFLQLDGNSLFLLGSRKNADASIKIFGLLTRNRVETALKNLNAAFGHVKPAKNRKNGCVSPFSQHGRYTLP